MSSALRKFIAYELREKQAAHYRNVVLDEPHGTRSEKQEMLNKTRLTQAPTAEDVTQAELELDKPVVGESKNERFKRVANYRLKTSIERLRMLRQMFEGSTVNNYEFTLDQANTLTKALYDEVDEIQRLMRKRLDGRNGDIPQL